MRGVTGEYKGEERRRC
ncbi:hypothetical protein EYF80_059753 [Liparis tanakae]|uniref:Uncharacterized protein n=1 Tax=Liparis tanakae TaxID=230148 RepID=A0A4Z2EMC1_9TELE|nr:hypothetical protein EYF80_059753 [Liparis tanakae]